MRLETSETVVRLLRQAATTTRLRNTVNVIRGGDKIGRQVAADFQATRPLLFDDLLPKWKYVNKCQVPSERQGASAESLKFRPVFRLWPVGGERATVGARFSDFRGLLVRSVCP